MAKFEIYDDIAFFWFIMSLLTVILIPYTIYMVYLFRQDRDGEVELKTKDGQQKWSKIREQEKVKKQEIFRSPTFIFFVILWACFVYGVAKFPEYKDEQLATFNPYETLGIEVGATDQEIKKAYRKQSLIYHPDKNPGDKEAATKFMELTKAHDILTDEVAKKNWELYGNPDGNSYSNLQSVTLGLPSFLLKQANEIPVLVLYLLMIVVVPPVIVGIWWSRSSGIHESGVCLVTIQRYYYFIQHNTKAQFLIEMLCSADEFKPFRDRRWKSPELQENIATIHNQIKNRMPMNGRPTAVTEKVFYSQWGTVLLFAHIGREHELLHDYAKHYLNTILASFHKLLAVLLDLGLAKFPKYQTIKEVMVLSQHVVQAVDFHASSLYQIPHIGQKEVSRLLKEKIESSHQLKSKTPEERKELLKGFTDEELKDVEVVCDLLPNPALVPSWNVDGEEEELFEEDTVQVNIYVSRQNDPNDPRLKKSKTKKTDKKDDVSDDEELFKEEAKKRLEKKKRKTMSSITAHAPYFPEKKPERWVVVLADENGDIHGFEKVSSLKESQDITIPVFASWKGTKVFHIYLLCDSYLECDRHVTLKLNSKPKPSEGEQVKVALEDNEELIKEKDEKEEEVTFWWQVLDIVATICFLLFIGVGLYIYASQKPWFQTHLQPRIDSVLEFISPVTSTIATLFSPLTDLWVRYVSPYLHVEVPDPIEISPDKLIRGGNERLV